MKKPFNSPLRLSVLLGVLGPLWGWLAFGQQIELVPPNSFAEQQRQLQAAFRSWQQADYGLESRITRDPPEVSLRRIERGREAMRRYYELQFQFLGSLARAYEAMLEIVDPSSTVPTAGVDVSERLKAVLREQAQALQKPPKLPRGARGELARQEEQKILASLKQLSEAVEAQQKLLELSKGQAEEELKVRMKLTDTLSQLKGLVEDQLELEQQNRQHWEAYYDILEAYVRQRSGLKSQEKQQPEP